MVKPLRSVPAPQTMVANAVPASVFSPISQVHVTLPTASARGTQAPGTRNYEDQFWDQRSDEIPIRGIDHNMTGNDESAFDCWLFMIPRRRCERSALAS